MSVRPWELIDNIKFTEYLDGAAFCKDLRDRMIRSIQADQRLPRLDEILTNRQVEDIVDCCVPVQRWRPDKRAEVEARARDAELKLREQQRPILKLAAQNSHLIVSGAAGTGKTLTAIELAIRSAENGQRVGLVCFNRLVGDWMAETVKSKAPALPQLVAGSAIQTLCRMAGVSVPKDAPEEFFQRQLPDLLDAKFSDEELLAVSAFDVLIIDEAQDVFARPHLRESLLRLVKRGPYGKTIVFGDFENQVLSNREEVRAALEAFSETTRPVKWRLDENCRNYQTVGDTAVSLAGFQSKLYSAYVRGPGAIDNVDFQYYKNDDHQSLIVRNWLDQSIADGYRKSEIILLSFNADPTSAAARLRKGGIPLQPAYNSGTLTRFSSVHAFKGLESKVVILTDVDLEPGLLDRSLFYTGVTRATERVRIACSNRSIAVLNSWIHGGGKP
jgi:superfamily I DNA/RNA helicase